MGRIAQDFFAQAKRLQRKTALVCAGQSLSYQELAAQVAHYAHFLLTHGVKPGEHLGVALPNSVEAVALLLCCEHLGVTIVPLNPDLTPAAVQTAVLCSDIRHFAARRSFFKRLGDLQKLCPTGLKICLDSEYPGTVPLQESSLLSAVPPAVTTVADDPLFILTLTSGSTGDPKPIALTQENKYRRAVEHNRWYGVTDNDVVLAATPLYHSLAERLTFMPLVSGATLVLLPHFTPQLWLQSVLEDRVTFTIAVSSQLKQVAQLLQGNGGETGALRLLVSSSALLEAPTRELLCESLHCAFREMYGTSETSTVTDIDCKESGNARSVGKALPWAKVKILREDGTEAVAGERGEIAVQSQLLCAPYYHKEPVFEGALWQGYFKTGDLGYLDEEGYLYYTGRLKDLIISGGVNIYPQDLERALLNLEGVVECAACALPDERLGEVPGVAVVFGEGSTLTVEHIQYHCLTALPAFAQPRRIIIVTELPKNPMGKLVRARLHELFTATG